MALNTSSLLDLKAELLKKTEEIKRDKLQKASKLRELRNVNKKPSVFSRKNAGVLQRAQRDLEAKQEAEDVMSLSRKKLEAKTQLYEKMAGDKAVTDHDGSHGFLVDFEQKSIRNISSRREQERQKEQEEKEREEEAKASQEEVPEPEDPAEQWVDYVDSFGRSRRCLKKDLPELQKMDKEVQGHKKPEGKDVESDKTMEKPDLMSADMYREMIRQKWEEEERQNMTNPDGPLHYANVQFNEVRTHGVGYYQFDKDHGSREEQLSALRELREQTKDQREKKEQLKQKRKAILKARLAKVKQRKLVKEGKDASTLPSSSESSDEEHMIGPQLGEMHKGEGRSSPELLTRDETLRRDAPVRDWDLGKSKDEFDEEKWLSNRRDERLNDFAPPSFYYDTQPIKLQQKQKKWSTNQTLIKPKGSDSNIEIFSKGPDTKPKPKDPMAMLEQLFARKDTQENPDCKKQTEASIIDGLHKIRSEMESDANPTFTGNQVQVAPTESIGSVVFEKTTNTYKESIGIPKNTLLLPPPPPPPPIMTESIQNNTKFENSQFHQTNISSYPKDFSHLPPPPPPPPPPPLPPSSSEYDNMQRLIPPTRAKEHAYGYELDTTQSTLATSLQYVPDFVNNKSTIEPATDNDYAPHVLENSEKSSAPKPKTIDSKASLKLSASAVISSAPVKYDRFTRPVFKPRYERVNLHELPGELPAPPTVGNVPVYPSQEEVFGSKDKKNSEEALQKSWHRQFQGTGGKNSNTNSKNDISKETKIDKLKPKNIPFVSPYVQATDNNDEKDQETLEFDPSKPPPIKP